ncbi:MAG: bifunctional diaminohydroxyphosphoribosylaminopyrimidine deaminase/5-amino-6-(5-phosphoribosylamino)uracil reductase RibD [Bacteroidota bacterium]
MYSDEIYMQRALELAVLGSGYVSPNPMVGCVIVHQGKIIGEGWHKCYGESHAEVNAVRSVADKTLLPEATAYVTLEPCSHHGKTPPCADLLIQHRLKRVVISNVDTNPLVGGQGIIKLQQAGIEVTTGILEAQGRLLNSRFFTFMEKKRPYLLLKWAETADGFIARPNYDSKWISSELSRKLVHQWRAQEDGVLVGTRTALYDNPKLNVRDWQGRNPVRMVIDTQLQLPSTLHLFDHSQLTLCFNHLKEESQENLEYIKIKPEHEILPQILKNLHERKVQSLIVEGGSQLLNSFIQLDLWDEVRLFRSRQLFEEGIKAPLFNGLLSEHSYLYEDELLYFRPTKTGLSVKK